MSFTNITTAQLVTEVRELINEPTAVLFSDTDITAWIDFAASEMSRSMLCGEIVVSDQLETGVQGYDWKTYLPNPEAVIYYGSSETAAGTVGRTLIKTHPKQMKHNADRSSDGAPLEWWYDNEKIWVYPLPAVTQNNHYLRIIAHSYYTTYVLTTVPPYLQEYTIWYALAKCFEKKKNYAAAQQYMAIFDSFIMFHRIDNMYPKPVDSKDMMQTQDRTRVIQGGG